MNEVDFTVVDTLLDWDEKLSLGNHALDILAIQIRKSGATIEGVPIVFYAPQSVAAIRRALEAGVDFTVRNPDQQTVLFEDALCDDEGFGIVADHFAQRRKIELADAEGLTPLSVQVKFGNVEKSRILLERGASVHATATIAR